MEESPRLSDPYGGCGRFAPSSPCDWMSVLYVSCETGFKLVVLARNVRS